MVRFEAQATHLCVSAGVSVEPSQRCHHAAAHADEAQRVAGARALLLAEAGDGGDAQRRADQVGGAGDLIDAQVASDCPATQQRGGCNNKR